MSAGPNCGATCRWAHSWHGHCFDIAKEVNVVVDIPNIMNAFAPDLSQYWLPASATANAADVASRDEDPVAAALTRELEALVDRVNAARCIF